MENYQEAYNSCSLVCQSTQRPSLVVKLDDQVVDGTRCSKDSLDMCIDGQCQVLQQIIFFICDFFHIGFWHIHYISDKNRLKSLFGHHWKLICLRLT